MFAGIFIIWTFLCHHRNNHYV